MNDPNKIFPISGLPYRKKILKINLKEINIIYYELILPKL